MEDLSELMNIHIRERSLPYLQPVEKDFYKKLIRRYRELEERFKKSLRNGTLDDIFKLRTEMKNFYDIINEIYRIRLEKLVKKAIKIVEENDSIPEGLSEEEEIFIKEIIEILKRNKERIFGIKIEEKKEIIEEKKPEEKEIVEKIKEEKKEEIEYIVVRMLNDIPEIVGIDGTTYGPFKKNDIVLLPKENAKALKNKKLVEII